MAHMEGMVIGTLKESPLKKAKSEVSPDNDGEGEGPARKETEDDDQDNEDEIPAEEEEDNDMPEACSSHKQFANTQHAACDMQLFQQKLTETLHL